MRKDLEQIDSFIAFDNLPVASEMLKPYNKSGMNNAGMLEIILRGMKDSLESQRKTSEVQELQLKYDYNELGKTKNRIMRITFYSLIFVVVVIFCITSYSFVSYKGNGSPCR